MDKATHFYLNIDGESQRSHLVFAIGKIYEIGLLPFLAYHCVIEGPICNFDFILQTYKNGHMIGTNQLELVTLPTDAAFQIVGVQKS